MKENKVMPRVLPILLAAVLVIISFQIIPLKGAEENDLVAILEDMEETRSSIDFEDPEYTIDASQHDFPIDLSTVSHLSSILNYYPINASQKEFLENHGFVNLGKSWKYGGSGYYDLVTLYKDLKELGLAPYITTDAMLHVYHIFFDEILKDIEEEYFFELLMNMTLQLIEATTAQVNSATSMTIEITHIYKADSIYGPVSYSITETISLKEALVKNLEFLYVALKILDPTAIVPSYLRPNVNAELDLIKSNEGFANSPIFDQSEVHDILTYIEDYSQYKPRGHYTKSEILMKYFNTMMWYGRMSFRMKSAMETVQAILLSEALMMKPSITKVGALPASTMWDQIYEVTSFFVGKSDDLTPYDYQKLTAQVFGNLSVTYSGLLNAKLIQLYTDKVIDLRKPRISSSFVRADLEDIVNATIGLRLMGQRLVPDSYMFQNLVFPAVGAYKGGGTPFTYSEIIGWGPGKGFPRGLEAMAILGNDMAEDYLIRDGDVQYDKYDEQYGKLKAEFSNIDQTTWESNLYWGWLYALDSLNEDFTESNYPSYMRNRGYLSQKLNTNLGSWTELRHDTILYAKQSYSPTCGISYPVGYIEPVPKLYSRLKDLTNSTKENLQDFEVISDSVADDLDDFIELLGKLQDFSERELKNVPLNETEYNFIKMFGWSLEDLLVNVPEDAGDSRLVADVHTDPNRDPKDGVAGKVLEEAVGNFDLILVIWNDTANDENGTLRASLGPIFSYYEFKQPLSERLTDEEWRGILENDTNVPEQFNWQDYPEDYPDLVDVDQYYDLWVSTEEIYFSEPDEKNDVITIQSFVHNRNELDREVEINLYLDTVEESSLLERFDITTPGQGSTFIEYEWDITGLEEKYYRVYVNVSGGDENDYKPNNNLAMGFVNTSNVTGPDIDWDDDGVVNIYDSFPFDPAASVDTDGDGYPDEWNEGMSEEDSTTGLVLDIFPLDPLEWFDSDEDGVGDNSDAFPLDPLEWSDRDGDGVGDNSDMFPDDELEWIDTDGDGVGDNSDVFPDDVHEWADSDGDGFGDNSDVFPDDVLEWLDSDGDGHGDNSDEFPDNASEWIDTDKDGWGDNIDMWPEDPQAWYDSDGDGYHDGIDLFPNNPFDWSDRDGDGVGDNSDMFPNDSNEWIDTDGDGVGDNSDEFMLDPTEWKDSDEDEVGDNSDAFPDDPSASMDTDGDGYPDRWNNGMNEEDSTAGLKLDQYPNDPDKWDSIGVEEDDGMDLLVVLAIVILICIVLLVIISLVVRQRIAGGGERLSRYWDDVINDRIQEGDRLEDEEMERLLEESLENEEISIETYQEILSMHLGDEY